MEKIKQNCLTCKYYRLIESDSGVCRVDKSIKPNYPETKNEESCGKWNDCGQHYFIRVGWIKRRIVVSGKEGKENKLMF